jgi:hypothetical protein
MLLGVHCPGSVRLYCIGTVVVRGSDPMTAIRKGQQAAMVQRTCSILRYGLEGRATSNVAYHTSLHTEADWLQVPGVGPATIKLIKAWLLLHNKELRHD